MGFWKTLGKIGAFAAPIIAAPFTGGASLALIGAGAGAAGGALSGGGWKGALLGAGLGGATAGLGGGAGGAASSAAKDTGMSVGSSIGKSILKNIPQIAGELGPVLSTAASGSAAQRNQEAPNLAAAYNANLGATKFGDQRAMLASLLGGVQDASIARPAGSTIPTFGISGGLRPSALSGKDSLLARLQTPIKPLEMPTAGALEKGLGYAGLAGNILKALPHGAGSTPPVINDVANPVAGVPAMPWTLPQSLPPLVNPGGGGIVSGGIPLDPTGIYNPSSLNPFGIKKPVGYNF